MTSVQLPSEQYRSYDEDGDVLATRSVTAHTLAPDSEFGPGIAVQLRSGFEPGTGDDGIGVDLTLTTAQLGELGYVQAGSELEGLASQVITMAREAAAPFIMRPVSELLAEMGDYVFAPEPEPKPNMLDLLGGISLETYQEAVRRAFPETATSHLDPACHETPGYKCLILEDIREQVVEIINEDLARERQQPAKFAYCRSDGRMVNLETLDGRNRPFHDFDTLGYCTVIDQWVQLWENGVRKGHYIGGRLISCIDRTGNMVHPEAK